MAHNRRHLEHLTLTSRELLIDADASTSALPGPWFLLFLVSWLLSRSAGQEVAPEMA